MASRQLPKLTARVRFPSSAPWGIPEKNGQLPRDEAGAPPHGVALLLFLDSTLGGLAESAIDGFVPW
jgi:hypothetical protein